MCEIPQRTADRSAIVPELDQALIRKEVRHVLGVLRTGSKVCYRRGFGRPLALADPARAADATTSPCSEDAMIVFDASGSMAGNVSQGIATIKPRIDEARHALAAVLHA